MNLYETTPENILQEIERRSDALLHAELEYVNKDTNLKAWEAATAVAYKDSGMSVAEAEKRLRGGADWPQMYREVQSAAAQVEKLKRDHRRAMLAAELWRTEQSNRRVV